MAYKPKQKLGQLPEHHYEADREWINKMLSYLTFDPIDDSKNERGKVCRAYSKAYREAASLELTLHKKTTRDALKPIHGLESSSRSGLRFLINNQSGAKQ